MKIYLAGGFSIINIKGREQFLSNLFNPWKRLFSFYMEGTNVKPKDIWIFNKNLRRRNANK
jgi:hypothetical protein